MSKYKTHEEFFAAAEGGYEIVISLEELYQHFKARLITEVYAVTPELLNAVELQDLEQKTQAPLSEEER